MQKIIKIFEGREVEPGEGFTRVVMLQNMAGPSAVDHPVYMGDHAWVEAGLAAELIAAGAAEPAPVPED